MKARLRQVLGLMPERQFRCARVGGGCKRRRRRRRRLALPCTALHCRGSSRARPPPPSQGQAAPRRGAGAAAQRGAGARGRRAQQQALPQPAGGLPARRRGHQQQLRLGGPDQLQGDAEADQGAGRGRLRAQGGRWLAGGSGGCLGLQQRWACAARPTGSRWLPGLLPAPQMFTLSLEVCGESGKWEVGCGRPSAPPSVLAAERVPGCSGCAAGRPAWLANEQPLLLPPPPPPLPADCGLPEHRPGGVRRQPRRGGGSVGNRADRGAHGARRRGHEGGRGGAARSDAWRLWRRVVRRWRHCELGAAAAPPGLARRRHERRVLYCRAAGPPGVAARQRAVQGLGVVRGRLGGGRAGVARGQWVAGRCCLRCGLLSGPARACVASVCGCAAGGGLRVGEQEARHLMPRGSWPVVLGSGATPAAGGKPPWARRPPGGTLPVHQSSLPPARPACQRANAAAAAHTPRPLPPPPAGAELSGGPGASPTIAAASDLLPSFPLHRISNSSTMQGGASQSGTSRASTPTRLALDPRLHEGAAGGRGSDGGEEHEAGELGQLLGGRLPGWLGRRRRCCWAGGVARGASRLAHQCLTTN
jgi:hypothetical protein